MRDRIFGKFLYFFHSDQQFKKKKYFFFHRYAFILHLSGTGLNEVTELPELLFL